MLGKVIKRISFLDVDIIRNENGSLSTAVYRKSTDTNVYINWSSFAPKEWKIGTLKGLVRRAYLVCSTQAALQKELSFLKFVFRKYNGYPSKVVFNTILETKKKLDKEKELQLRSETQHSEETNTSNSDEVIHHPHLKLPYKGKMGEGLITKFRNKISQLVSSNIKPRITYQGKKLNNLFPLKDKIKKEHSCNLVYSFSSSLDENKKVEYVGETKVRFEDRVDEHIRRDKKSSIYKHINDNNITVNNKNFNILDKGFSNTRDRKLAEALYIRDYQPPLNEQVRSYKLLLFND